MFEYFNQSTESIETKWLRGILVTVLSEWIWEPWDFTSRCSDGLMGNGEGVGGPPSDSPVFCTQSLHCAQNGAVLWESGEGGRHHCLGSLWCGGDVAAGEEAIDEEEAGFERLVWVAWQPVARRNQRFLQQLIGGDEGDKEDEGEEKSLSVTCLLAMMTSWTVGANGAFALADVVSYHCHRWQTSLVLQYMRARRWPRWPASSKGNQQEGW